VLKHSLGEAKTTLKDMVSRFIEQLGVMSENTGAYHGKLDDYARVIRETDDIGELNTLLDDLMRDTRQIQIDTERSREGIIAVRVRAETAEQKVRELEAELVHASELVREDQLTGVLNRRGLDEAFERELSRVERNPSPLCAALLDLDNFKRLNDAHGHQTGDRALVHMIEIVKTTVRPHDIVARYGGEEFLILLPDTEIDEAVMVITRLQRNLTTHFFLHNNEKLLITFSGGVAQLNPGEDRESLVERADTALYRAKAAGKNRVVAAD
jgi:diguanylate cyclase